MFDRVIGVLAPHVCLVCGREGSLLCASCSYDALPPLPDRCYRCKSISQDSAVCQKCRKHTVLKYVWPRAQYSGPAKDLVYSLKFARARAAARLIADLLDEAVPALPPGTLVTYIPTATSRVRFRGYDQSRLIAKAFARKRNLRLVTALARIGQTRQVGSDRKHRLAQAAQNYRVQNQSKVKGAEILLIDDILTTGATLESAAKLIKLAGAKQVSAAVFAQKQ